MGVYLAYRLYASRICCVLAVSATSRIASGGSRVSQSLDCNAQEGEPSSTYSSWAGLFRSCWMVRRAHGSVMRVPRCRRREEQKWQRAEGCAAKATLSSEMLLLPRTGRCQRHCVASTTGRTWLDRHARATTGWMRTRPKVDRPTARPAIVHLILQLLSRAVGLSTPPSPRHMIFSVLRITPYCAIHARRGRRAASPVWPCPAMAIGVCRTDELACRNEGRKGPPVPRRRAGAWGGEGPRQRIMCRSIIGHGESSASWKYRYGLLAGQAGARARAI